MKRGILLGLAIGLVSLAAYLGTQYIRGSCPCGFVWVYPPGGCQVDIYNQNPCQGGGGPNSSGNPPSPGGGPGSGVITGGLPPGNCGVRTGECMFTPEWSALSFITTNSDGTTMAGVEFDVVASILDTNSKSCLALQGTITSPGGSRPTVKIPLDASAVSKYPRLKVEVNDSCRPFQYSMAAYPKNSKCGCKIVDWRR